MKKGRDEKEVASTGCMVGGPFRTLLVIGLVACLSCAMGAIKDKVLLATCSGLKQRK